MGVFETFIVNQAVSFVVPMVAGYLKAYLTPGAEVLLCNELKALVPKLPAGDAQNVATTAVNALAAAWGV